LGNKAFPVSLFKGAWANARVFDNKRIETNRVFARHHGLVKALYDKEGQIGGTAKDS
jgi:hypothetical protein